VSDTLGSIDLLSLGGPGMASRALWENQQTYNEKSTNHRGGYGPAESKTSIGNRFIQKVSDSGSQGPRQNESSQRDARNAAPHVKRGNNRQRYRKNNRASLIPEAAGVGQIWRCRNMSMGGVRIHLPLKWTASSEPSSPSLWPQHALDRLIWAVTA
jgi:hypothetical protein